MDPTGYPLGHGSLLLRVLYASANSSSWFENGFDSDGHSLGVTFNSFMVDTAVRPRSWSSHLRHQTGRLWPWQPKRTAAQRQFEVAAPHSNELTGETVRSPLHD
jgi:hypothetical protein